MSVVPLLDLKPDWVSGRKEGVMDF